MTKGRNDRDRKKQKRQNRQRQLNKQKREAMPLAREVTPKLADKLDNVYRLIRTRRFAEAQQLLDRLYERYDKYPAVVEALVFLYQTTRDHERCCQAAARLVKLTPRDPDARLIYAQESMFSGRATIALVNYRLFLQRWPGHANARKAQAAIELLEPEVASRLENTFLGDTNLDLLVNHEEVLQALQNGQFEDAAETCLKLLKQAPDFIPARNNLALAYFQTGQVDKAVHVARETFRAAPDNRFAEAMFGKLCFLSGAEDEANAIADRIVANPPAAQDPLAAAFELLSFLGRDENIVVLYEGADEDEIADPRCQAMLLHHLAVAQCRLGDEAGARSSWKKCLQAMPNHTDARENLQDLDEGLGHAPWPEPVSKWIPREIFDNMFGDKSGTDKRRHLDLANDHPAIAALISPLLDRGDPLGRELAMKMAAADGSPAMLDALYQFALSKRGPDAMRHEAMQILGQKGRVDAGPHRFYLRGEWTEIKLFMAEIHWEATRSALPWVQELSDAGSQALSNGNYALAEKLFQQILDGDPDNVSAAYNLCVVWLQRDGETGRRRAQARIEEIHERFPDYLFASISLAQFAAMDGELDRARDLLRPIFDVKKLHASEALALFATEVQIAVKRREFGSAEKSLATFAQIAGEDDPRVARLRRLIDDASSTRGIRRLLSGV